MPKRTEQKHGHHTAEDKLVQKAPAGAEPVWHKPDPAWHPRARELYRAARESGQARFYEQSDIAILCYVCDALTRSLRDNRFSGQLFHSVMSAMNDLAMSEGARRRVKLELQRDDADDTSEVDAAIAELSHQHAQVSGG
ncbi:MULTISPECIES: hypothetical protein [unclassified Pseudonocardia]|uniref:phage terminase small subunit n=1 Tax=unclassified Pseudonocardia TaxID=2619320 RepID=UPI001CF65C38|nr:MULTISPECIES: hypothetical protein [unclassified Pseudonocardia]